MLSFLLLLNNLSLLEPDIMLNLIIMGVAVELKLPYANKPKIK